MENVLGVLGEFVAVEKHVTPGGDRFGNVQILRCEGVLGVRDHAQELGTLEFAHEEPRTVC